MDEIEKLIQITNKEHDRDKKPAKLFMSLLWISLILTLGILLLAVVAWLLSSVH
jgi:flagellar basal body-associated protein FliL